LLCAGAIIITKHTKDTKQLISGTSIDCPPPGRIARISDSEKICSVFGEGAVAALSAVGAGSLQFKSGCRPPQKILHVPIADSSYHLKVDADFLIRFPRPVWADLNRNFPIEAPEKIKQIVGSKTTEMAVHQMRYFRLFELPIF
jgi:hypothetical protein